MNGAIAGSAIFSTAPLLQSQRDAALPAAKLCKQRTRTLTASLMKNHVMAADASPAREGHGEGREKGERDGVQTLVPPMSVTQGYSARVQTVLQS